MWVKRADNSERAVSSKSKAFQNAAAVYNALKELMEMKSAAETNRRKLMVSEMEKKKKKQVGKLTGKDGTTRLGRPVGQANQYHKLVKESKTCAVAYLYLYRTNSRSYKSPQEIRFCTCIERNSYTVHLIHVKCSSSDCDGSITTIQFHQSVAKI